jgi:endonuclease III
VERINEKKKGGYLEAISIVFGRQICVYCQRKRCAKCEFIVSIKVLRKSWKPKGVNSFLGAA